MAAAGGGEGSRVCFWPRRAPLLCLGGGGGGCFSLPPPPLFPSFLPFLPSGPAHSGCVLREGRPASARFLESGFFFPLSTCPRPQRACRRLAQPQSPGGGGGSGPLPLHTGRQAGSSLLLFLPLPAPSLPFLPPGSRRREAGVGDP